MEYVKLPSNALRKLSIVAWFGLVSLWISACGSSADPTAVPVSPTIAPDPVPTVAKPTSTPIPTRIVSTATATIVASTTESVGSSDSVTSTIEPPEIGKHTAGTTIVIGGTEIRLPGHIFVSAWQAEAPCDTGRTCPTSPYWTLQSEDAFIEIDGEGRVWEELIGCGDPDPFSVVKQLLRP
jgi:hypothetical protein